jgi:pilus assembly protein Flp/PilA
MDAAAVGAATTFHGNRGYMPAGGNMKTSIRQFLHEEDGITALEYGVLAAIVAAAIVAVFKTPLQNLLTNLLNAIASAAGSSTASGG